MGKVCIVFVLGLVTLVGGAARSTQIKALPGAEMTGYFKEVRMRKMFLVRPDLIPYPVVQEFYA